MRLEGKVAVVAGGANGIGRATSVLFAREGARVAVADRDADAGAACLSEIASAADGGFFARTDVSSDAEVESLMDETVRRFGGLDILVNAAGIDIKGTVAETEPARWQRVLDVNLAGVYRACRCAIPHMIDRGSGSIVNVASIQGLFGYPRYAAYAASKAGMVGLTRQVAVDYADQGIRSNAVSPGAIVTDIHENSRRLEPEFDVGPADPADAGGAGQGAAVQYSGLRGHGMPIDVAHAILFLASDEARHISGHNLVVDGISTARVV
ncbi:MAG: SDR family oxidoreductase [Candidatus Latescibacteria bacterium]|jgi:NAD(P)-dependent dehydrogenase (short-subunit alcohol dehydrogenase family)|nr:SDR family oxidoreductase [Candidatus Latescibacterota bacterium]